MSPVVDVDQRRGSGVGVLGLPGGRELVAGFEVFLAFDADVRQDPAKPAGQVPVVLAQDDHARGHEQAADDRGVEDDGDGQADAELLDGGVAVEDEAAEHSTAGLDTFWPSWPPVSTWIPAAWAGLAAALMIVWASSTDSAPGLTDKVTDKYPVAWSLLSAEAPCEVSGLITEATSGALATSAAAWLTAPAYLESVSFPLLTCSTIGLVPLA